MTAEEMLKSMSEEEIKNLQNSNGDASRKARAAGLDRKPFSEIANACQLALIAFDDARIYQKKLVTRGQESAAWKNFSLDVRNARMMIIVESHILDNEEVKIREPFDYSW